MNNEKLGSAESGGLTEPLVDNTSGESSEGQSQMSKLSPEEEQRHQQEDEKGLGTVRAEIANSGDQSESLAKPLLPRYIDRSGIPTREMREREEDKQDQEYVRNKGIFPTGRVDLISRAISLLRRVKYKGLKGEGEKKDFDHVELGKKIEMLSRGYHLSYRVDAVPGDVSEKLSVLFEKAKKAPGFEKKFDFDMATARLLEEFEIESPDEQN